MSFGLYLLGFALVIAGVAWALITIGIATVYIAIACLILFGVAILTGVTRTRPKDPNK